MRLLGPDELREEGEGAAEDGGDTDKTGGGKTCSSPT